MLNKKLAQQISNSFLKADAVAALSQSSNDALLGFRLHEDADCRLSLSACLGDFPVTLGHL